MPTTTPTSAHRGPSSDVTVSAVPEVVLPPPCSLPAPEQSGTALTGALPMLTGLGSMVMMAGMSGVGQARTFVAGGFFLLSTALVVATQVARQRRQHLRRVDETRAAFQRELTAARASVEAAAAAQRHELERDHPTLEDWLAARTSAAASSTCLAGTPGRTTVRVGTATVSAAREVVAPPAAEPERADPVALRAVRALASRAAVLPAAPLVVDLAEWDEVVVCGENAVRQREQASHLVCQAVIRDQPAALRVVLACAPDRVDHWEWLKWLPHHRQEDHSDVAAGCRLLVDAAGTSTEGQRTLLVVDGVTELPDALVDAPATTVLRLAPTHERALPGRGRAVLRLVEGPTTGGGARARWMTATGTTPCELTPCPTSLAELVARRLDGDHHRPEARAGARLDDLPALVGVHDVPRWDPASWWLARRPHEQLRVPIGLDLDGQVVHLDLKESAQGGDGPHGLVVGATGSGKSELLRTLVLGLALEHSPDDLGMVLVDFKGGATFAGLGELPHVSAVVTNLGDDLALVDRMADTLTGELVRRQELLRDTGHASLVEHRRARLAGDDLEPLPSLFVCIDEFSELLSARPEFIDVFVAIGRVGRSLGVHLLLASQRIEEGRLRGLETHLSYRVGLRTFSAAESRAAIGTPDAHTLPPAPGAGYLATGAGSPTRFTAAYVSGRPPCPEPTAPVHRRPLPWTLHPVPDPPSLRRPVPPQAAHPEHGAVEDATTVDLVVARTRGLPRTRPVWLPPLTTPATLGALLGDVTHDREHGVHSPRWRRAAGRRVPVGVVDRPREQRRDVWTVDLSGAGGHCAVVGGPHSGRTTALRTLVTGLALTATPTEVQLLLLDHGGGGLAPLARLPHVVASAARGEPLLGRVVAEATDLVDRREAWFRAQGIDSFATYRARREEGTVDDGFGEVFVVVDGWGVLRADDPDAEAALHRVAERGLSVGVHLVLATHRWADLRPSLRDQVGSRLELRLGDPVDSVVDRRRAAGVPTSPGHGLVEGGHALLTAVPALEVPRGAPAPADPLAHLVTTVDRGWQGVRPRRLAPLPERVDLATLRTGREPAALLLGHDGDSPVVLPVTERHLLVQGGAGSGRTTALRTYVQELQRLHDPATMQLVLVDPRGSLEATVGADHLLHHLVSRAQMRARLGELATYLEGRLPGPDVTPAQLRDRSWWSGAEVTVVVDDHDLVTAGGWQDCGLHLLARLVPQAREVGLHLVVARRSAPGLRTADPAVQGLLDLEAPVLELSTPSPGRARLSLRSQARPRDLRVALPPGTSEPVSAVRAGQGHERIGAGGVRMSSL